MEGHDALIYGNFGKLYYQQKQITYSRRMEAAPNGFLFIGSQKPAFSLLFTWELMLNSTYINRTIHFDAYFRSISGYYGLLIVAIVFLWLYRKNRYLPIIALFLLMSGLSFFITILDHHLDSYRIFFLLVSWIWLGYAIKKRDSFSFYLFALFSGFAAFTHLIGLVSAIINLAAFFLFYESSIKVRFIRSIVFVFIIIAAGGIHYIFEATMGSLTGFLNYIK